MKKSFDEYVELVRGWSRDRQILQNSSVLAQAEKTGEEVLELVIAAAKLRVYDDEDTFVKFMSIKTQEDRQVALYDLKDAIGDVLVTLCNVASLAGVDMLECFGQAWNEIKDRKGYLGADGKFHKE